MRTEAEMFEAGVRRSAEFNRGYTDAEDGRPRCTKARDGYEEGYRSAEREKKRRHAAAERIADLEDARAEVVSAMRAVEAAHREVSEAQNVLNAARSSLHEEEERLVRVRRELAEMESASCRSS